MKWPWSKKIESIEPPKPDAEPDVDDWVSVHGDWVENEICHCGQSKQWSIDNPFSGLPHRGFYDVCPKCGHKDKWSKCVMRSICEESPARRKYYASKGYKYTNRHHWKRNESFEIWTPDHCSVKDENDPG